MAAIRGASLKQVARVTVSFCPFDPKTASARDFLLRISCRRMIDSNPKCQVISNFKNDGSEPAVDVVFSDKDTLTMKTSNLKLNHLSPKQDKRL
ncbi:hypothetical protein ACROYT_G032057 [Oculina patagonica]